MTEELGSEVNVIFRVDAPPVATEEIRAATDEDGERDPVDGRRAADGGVLRPGGRAHAYRARRADHAHARIRLASTSSTPTRGSRSTRSSPRRGAKRRPARDRGRRSSRSAGSQHSTVVPAPGALDHPDPAAGELGALDHRGQPEVARLGRRPSGRARTRPRRRSRGRSTPSAALTDLDPHRRRRRVLAGVRRPPPGRSDTAARAMSGAGSRRQLVVHLDRPSRRALAVCSR